MVCMWLICHDLHILNCVCIACRQGLCSFIDVLIVVLSQNGCPHRTAVVLYRDAERISPHPCFSLFTIVYLPFLLKIIYTVCVSVYILVSLWSGQLYVCEAENGSVSEKIVCSVPVLSATLVLLLLLHLSLSPLLYYLLDHQNVLHETKFDIFENAKYQSWHSVVWQVIHPLMKTKIWFGFCCISLDLPLSTQPLPHDSAVCEIRAHFLFSPPDNSWHILKEWLCLYATEFFNEHTVATEVFRHWSSTKMCECQYAKWQISIF